MRPLRGLLCASLLALAVGCGSSSNNTPAAQPTVTTSSGDTATAPTATTDAAPTTAPAATSPTTVEPTVTATTEPAATTPAATTPLTTPATTSATRPAAGGAQAVARGRAVLTRACGTCHEPGESDGPSAGKGWAEERMRTQVRQGGGRMRAISAARLNDADLDALVVYLRSIQAVR